MAKKTEVAEIKVPEMRRGEVTLRIIGTQPLFQNRMAEKVKHTHMAPRFCSRGTMGPKSPAKPAV